LSRPKPEVASGSSIKGIGAFVLVVATVWLGWQVIREPMAERLPPAQALRFSPGSSTVLSRAAEAELAAKRIDNADYLARESLTQAPFNVRALRVAGLVAAEKNETDTADEILTLAGNWSLRDDPAQAWLMNHRLSAGDYGSAFAHADTLARRRRDLEPDLFRLFSTAATLDPRSLPPLTRLLAADPAWRGRFLNELLTTDDGLSVSANLAVILADSPSGAFTTSEVSALYGSLLRKGRIPAMAEVRRRLGQPAPDLALVNGDFAPPAQPVPYEWRLFMGPGMTAEILADDLHPGNTALRIRYDGFGTRAFVEQFLQLAPGPYSLSGGYRTELGKLDRRVSWTVVCVESQRVIVDSRNASPVGTADWQKFENGFNVPSTGCTAQWIRLVPHAADRRENMVIWYDKLVIKSQ